MIRALVNLTLFIAICLCLPPIVLGLGMIIIPVGLGLLVVGYIIALFNKQSIRDYNNGVVRQKKEEEDPIAATPYVQPIEMANMSDEEFLSMKPEVLLDQEDHYK